MTTADNADQVLLGHGSFNTNKTGFCVVESKGTLGLVISCLRGFFLTIRRGHTSVTISDDRRRGDLYTTAVFSSTDWHHVALTVTSEMHVNFFINGKLGPIASKH